MAPVCCVQDVGVVGRHHNSSPTGRKVLEGPDDAGHVGSVEAARGRIHDDERPVFAVRPMPLPGPCQSGRELEPLVFAT